MPLIRTLAVLFAAAVPALAQPPGQNARSATFAHIDLNSADPDAAIAFWKDVIETSTYSRGSLNGVSMSGAFIVFVRKAPSGPSVGSTIDHLGLQVPDLQPFIDRLAKGPYKSFQPTPGGDVLMIDGPDGVRIELTADSSMYNPLAFGHIHLRTPQPSETQAWYAKHFGARHIPDDEPNVSKIPGVTLIFDKADAAAPTAGRAIDHISFEVRDVAAFSAALAADGIKVDMQGTSAFVTDPWGTRIELTQAGSR
jgi:catechol 2,3-dioxygenase-like lactoylglutathione lyase family enzyme